jgi:ABC-2 type transport system permease protein
MRNIWLVIKHDVGSTIRQRSFWLTTLLMSAVILGLVLLNTRDESGGPDISAGSESEQKENETTEALRIGLVDEAGLIKVMPAELPPDLFVHFANTAEARTALERGDIEQVVHIPPAYLQTGQIAILDQNFQIRLDGQDMGLAFNSGQEWMLPYAINSNLVGDEQLVAALLNPIPTDLVKKRVIEAPVSDEVDDQTGARVASIALPYIFYFLLLMGSSYHLRSVTSEKENRTVELLLLSIDPRQLMIGKIVAMSVVLLIQVVILAGGGLLLISRGGALSPVAGFAFPPGFLFLAALFLSLGYLLFASAMIAAGAIAPNAREAAPMTWILILPLLPTLMVGSLFAENPQSVLIIALSLFPLSAPSAMVTRLAVGPVPTWQVVISLAGLVITTYLFILLAARFFRAGNLLSDRSFKLKRLLTEWRS